MIVIGALEVRLIEWLQRVLGITAARDSEARTRRLASELHEAIADTASAARDRVRQVGGRQDWPRLYRERLDDQVKP